MKKTFFISLLLFPLNFMFSYPNFNVKVLSATDSKSKITSKIVICRGAVISNNALFFYTDCNGNYFTGGAEAGSEICLNKVFPYSTNIIVGGSCPI